MTVTAPTDVTEWIPELISASTHDKGEQNTHPLSRFADFIGDLEGKPGEKFMLPDMDGTTPAENLAVTVAATDDGLSGEGTEVTIKEAVKSIAFYDRLRYATGTDFNALAGRRVGAALNDRVELDLAAAAFAGRNAAADGLHATLTLTAIGAMSLLIPQRLSMRGMALFGEAKILQQLLSDTTVANAAAFGSDEAIREGAFTRPLLGVTPIAADEGSIPVGAANGLPQVMLISKGVLARVLQKAPTTEVERDARARLTRIVGTTLHAEGVRDSAGVVFAEIGTP